MLLEKVCESQSRAERETDGGKRQIFGGDDKVQGEDVVYRKGARGPCLTVSVFDTQVSASTDPTPMGLKATAEMLPVSRCASLSFCELL